MWTWVTTKIKGFKTLITSAAVAGVGIVNMAGGLDLRPLFSYFVKDESQLGAIMVMLGIIFAVLRVISTTPIGQAENLPQTVPMKIDAGV